MPLPGKQAQRRLHFPAASSERIHRALAYAQANQPRFTAELQRLIRFPTVSAQPRHAADLKRCAEWLALQLRYIGLDHASVVPTPGHPLVVGSWRRAVNRPTVLLYAHYDVQPVDPLAAWTTPPFEPAVRGEHVYGRGSTDDKGPLFAQLKALESLFRSSGSFPVNIVCLFEGEEEVGSTHLGGFLERYQAIFRADTALIADTLMQGVNQPTLTGSLRGGVSLEVKVRGPATDLHSGTFGGAVHNPLQALCEIIAALHDERGRVAVPGFYDAVRPVSREERQQGGLTLSNERVRQLARIERGWGERGFTLHERTTLRPALTLNGLQGGYQGPGGKGVIPAHATAKLSARLVPDQNPSEIGQLLQRHLVRSSPPTVKTSVKVTPGAHPVVLDRHHSAFLAATQACQESFGAKPVWVRAGGSIPVVSLLQRVLHITPVLLGLSLPTDNRHAPNERFHLPTFHQGIATFIRFLCLLGERS